MSLEAVGAENMVPDGERRDPEGPTIIPEVCVQQRPRHVTEREPRDRAHTPHPIPYTPPPRPPRHTHVHKLTYLDSSTFSGDSSDWKP